MKKVSFFQDVSTQVNAQECIYNAHFKNLSQFYENEKKYIFKCKNGSIHLLDRLEKRYTQKLYDLNLSFKDGQEFKYNSNIAKLDIYGKHNNLEITSYKQEQELEDKRQAQELDNVLNNITLDNILGNDKKFLLMYTKGLIEKNQANRKKASRLINQYKEIVTN